MKAIRVLLFLTFILSASGMFGQRPGTDNEVVTKLTVGAFQKNPSSKPGTSFRTGFIQNDAEAEQLLDSLKLKDAGFRNWIEENNPSENSHCAIVFIQHQFNPKALGRNDGDEVRKKICLEYDELKADSLSIEKCLANVDKKCFDVAGTPTGDQLDYIVYLKSRLDSISAKMDQLKEDYSASKGKFVELDAIVSYVYHFERGNSGVIEHSDYLLATNEIYIVLIGGKTDIAGSSISTKRNDTRLQTEAKSAGSFAFDGLIGTPVLNIPRDLFPGPDKKCLLELELAQISITLLHVSSHEMRIPGELIITPLGKSAVTLAIHARQFGGLQAGILTGKLELRTYTFVNDTLDVMIPFEKTTTDVLPFVFFQFYPGRDIDRLTPLSFREWKRYDLRNRIGIYGGIRLSKKPLETISAGISFALGPNVNLMGGVWLNRTLKTVNNYYVGPLQDIDRLNQFAPTFRPVYFSFGISVSPSIYKDWFSK